MKHAVQRAVACLFLLAMAARVHADRLMQRGGAKPLEGTITRIDDNGVSIRSSTNAERTVTWDLVRSVETSDPSLQRKAEEYREVADALWRARSRLDRGDMAMAESLFDRLFARYRGETSETALIVAEGVLRCRIARAANDAAIVPALEVARLRRKNIKTDAYRNLPPAFDEAMSLWQRLPPAWAPSAALARTETELKSYDAGGDTVVAALANLYRAAARQQLALGPEDSAPLAADHPGVQFMKSLVQCGASDADQRAAARVALEKRLPELPSWAQSWARFAVGQSLLRESGVGRQQEGLVSLAYLPASFAAEQPYLAALALATLSAQLQRMGEAEAAASMRNELIRMFPNHPAMAVLESASAAADSRADSPGDSTTARRTDPAAKDPA